MKTSLKDLNDYLFKELDKLMDENLTKDEEKFQKEIQRSKAITDVASKVIDNASTVLQAIKYQEEYGCDTTTLLIEEKHD